MFSFIKKGGVGLLVKGFEIVGVGVVFGLR